MGAREQEVQYATWRDLSLDAKTFTVAEKLDLGFTSKDKEEGAIPIPDSLVELLRARRLRYPASRLIFSNTLGTANGHLLRIIKRVGKRAGLNCGHCYNRAGLCCATKEYR
jgi:integrase/recombinase XerD